MNHRINESMKHSMNSWISESVSQWFKKTMNHRIILGSGDMGISEDFLPTLSRLLESCRPSEMFFVCRHFWALLANDMRLLWHFWSLTSSTRTRRGGSCLRDILKKPFSSIELHAPCTSQARACVLCAKLLRRCCPRTWPAHDPGAMQRQANTFLTLHTAHFTLHTCTSHLHFALDTSSYLKSCELFSPHLSSSHLIPSLLTCHLI